MEGKWLMAALVTIASVATAVSATNHVVRGNMGWNISPANTSFYSQWASLQTFVVGDTLMFNFTTGMHNVIKVPKTSYDACSTSNQIGSTIQTGPATVRITTPGNHYYICGFPSHCSIGQKLAISVSPARKSSPGPSMPPASGGSMTPTTPSGTAMGPSAGGVPAAPMTPGGMPMGPSAGGMPMGPSAGGVPKNSAPSTLISSGYLASLAALSATLAVFLM